MSLVMSRSSVQIRLSAPIRTSFSRGPLFLVEGGCVPIVCDAPIKAGGKEWMKVPYGEGLASSTGPKLCAVVCKGGSEALAGVRAGRVLSREIRRIWGVDALHTSGRQHHSVRYRKCWMDPTRSQTLCMYGTFPHGNRESPWPLASDGDVSRVGKSQDVTQR